MKFSKKISIEILLIFQSIIFFQSNGFTQDIEINKNWPQFRGINTSGIASKNTKPPIEFGGSKNLSWELKLPKGHSSPCIWEENIVVTGCIEENKELQTICINRNSGHIKWIKSVFPDTLDGHHSIGNPAQSTVAIDVSGIYTYFGSYGILNYDFDGELIWEYKIPRSYHRWGTATSPIISNKYIIVNRDNQKDGRYLIALDKHNGQVKWKTDLTDNEARDPTCWSTPLIWNEYLILHRFGSIEVFNISDGTPVSSLKILTTGVSTPVASDEMIYVGTWHNLSEKANRGDIPKYYEFKSLLADFDINKDSLVSSTEMPKDLYVQIRPEIPELSDTKSSVNDFFGWIDANKDQHVDKIEWDNIVKFIQTWYEDAGLIALKPDNDGSINTKNVLWQQSEFISEVPSPLLYKKRIYIIKDGGTLTCMNESSGEIFYREKIGVNGAYFASPVAANGFVFIPAYKGKIIVIEASDDYKIKNINDMGEQIFATPAIIDNSIYVRTSGHLYSYESEIVY